MRLRARRKSAGVAIVTAIFLLVVVAGLAVAVVSLSSSQQTASAQDVQAQRAYHAAKAGIEWALYTGTFISPSQPQQQQPTPAASLQCTAQQNQISSTVRLNNGTFPGGFTVTVLISCDAADVAGIAGGGADDPTANHVSITSIACNQPVNNACPNPAPGPDYVQRQLRAQL